VNTSIVPFVATVALLLGTTILSGLTTRRSPEPLATPLEQIVPEIEGWQAAGDHVIPDGTLRALAPTAYLVRTYRKSNVPLDLFIAYYAQQRAGESMHSPKHCLPGSGWEIWKHDSAFIPVRGTSVEINKYSIQNSGSRMLMFYWYQSKTRIVANEYLGKMLLARDTVFSGHTAGSIVRIMLPDTPAATAEGVAFATHLIPEVERCFGSLVISKR
jgi:EpsI family protein